MKKTDNSKNYFAGLIIVLTVIYIVDEIASAMNSSMQPYVLIDLFKVPGGNILAPEYAKAVSTATVLSIPGYCFMFLTPFYKALADRFGRRLFLIINTAVMGLGLLVCFLAPNYYIYVLGVMMVTFVQTNDMQVMYIMETAPEPTEVAGAQMVLAMFIMACEVTKKPLLIYGGFVIFAE